MENKRKSKTFSKINWTQQTVKNKQMIKKKNIFMDSTLKKVQ